MSLSGMSKMSGRILAVAIVILMAAAMSTTTAFASESDAGHVEVKLTYNPQYLTDEMKSGFDIEKRQEIANEIIGKEFGTIEEAAAAFTSLYKDGEGYAGWQNGRGDVFTGNGQYYGTYQQDGNKTQVTLEGTAPFYVGGNSDIPEAMRNPVVAVEFIVHGNVSMHTDPSKTNTVRLGDTSDDYTFFRISDIRLTGADSDASISGNVQIQARVAGNSENRWPVYSGAFTVSGIEFTSTEGNTTLEADGSGNEAIASEETVLNVENCTFHNCLYSYVNDTTSKVLKKNIINNTFDGNGYDSYAYFLQGQGTDLLFEGNTITGYERGLNIQFESDSGNAVISENDISTDSADCGSIQLTNARTVEIVDNIITNPSGAAIRFYNNLAERKYSAEKTTIRDNTIDAVSLFQKSADGKDMVAFGEDMVLDFDVNENTISPDTDIYYDTAIWPVTVTGENVIFSPSPRADSTIPVNDESDLTVKFTAAEGYRVTDVKVDGQSVEERGSYTFENVTATHTFEVKTERIPSAVGGNEGTAGDGGKNQKTDSAQTGDDSSLMPWIILAGLAAAGMAGTLLFGRRSAN